MKDFQDILNLVTMTDNIGRDVAFKRRSYRSCIAEAYRHVAGNLWTITKRNWRWFLGLALVGGLLANWEDSVVRSATYVGFDSSPLQMLLLTVVQVAYNFALAAVVYGLINGKNVLHNVRRLLNTVPMVLAFLLAIAAFAVAALVAYALCGKNPEVVPASLVAGGILVAFVVALAVILPAGVVVCKYMVEPQAKLRKIFRKTFASAFRAWGFIFVTLFLAQLCVFIVYFAACLPNLLLHLAYSLSAYGMASMGDPDGLSAGFYVLRGICSFFSSGVMIYLMAFMTYALYFVYQTVECKAQDREAHKSEEKEG